VGAAFNRKTKIVLAGKVHRGGNVVGISCRNDVDTRFGSPRINPTQGFREARLVANVVRVLQTLEDGFAGGAFR